MPVAFIAGQIQFRSLLNGSLLWLQNVKHMCFVSASFFSFSNLDEMLQILFEVRVRLTPPMLLQRQVRKAENAVHLHTSLFLVAKKPIIHYHWFSRWSEKMLHLYKQKAVVVVCLVNIFKCIQLNNALHAWCIALERSRKCEHVAMNVLRNERWLKCSKFLLLLLHFIVYFN